MDTVVLALGFGLVCLASATVGQVFKRFGLPTITGYLFTGALAGSFVLGLLPSEEAASLRFVDEISLAVIAFVAGSELLVPELRPRIRPILSMAGGIIVVTLVLLMAATFVVTGLLPFTAELSTTARIATALLGGVVLLALSPPSTIAVIKEVRARGPFTRTALGVTILMDVAIIVLFAVATSIASALLAGTGVSLVIVGLIAVDLACALGIGLLTGLALRAILARALPDLPTAALVLGLGFAIYELSRAVKYWSVGALGHGIYIEPLLIALIGGFFVTNATPYRERFEDLLHTIGPAVYVAFFTITGLALKLDVLLASLPAAIALFFVRAAGIRVGAGLGARAVGEGRRVQRIAWMAFITQAGIALGLAREVAVQIPALGDAFATLIISVVVINEIVGPLFLKAGLRRVGEANEPDGERTGRTVVLLGTDAIARSGARLLVDQGWRVVVLDHDVRPLGPGIEVRPLGADTTAAALHGDDVGAVVALLDDETNLRVLRAAREVEGIERLVARPVESARTAEYRDLDVRLLHAGSAMASLVARTVTAPAASDLLLGIAGDHEVVQVTVENDDVAGRAIRDLRLPAEALILEIVRDGTVIVAHGSTRIARDDELVLLVQPAQVEEVRLRLGP